MAKEIVNVAKNTVDPSITALRGAFSHRAIWLYMLLDEAKKAGADWKSIGYEATFRTGCLQGEGFKKLIADSSLAQFKTEFAEPKGNGRKIFEIECVESTEDTYYLDFHYCPLVAAWQELGCSNEEIEVLCDIAMNGDRGIASRFDDFSFTLGRTIAQGHSCCEIRFDRNK